MKNGKNRAYQNTPPPAHRVGVKKTSDCDLSAGDPELMPTVKCGSCGRIFRFVKRRKLNDKRYTYCPGCGMSYAKTIPELEELEAQSKALRRAPNMRA